MHSIPIKLCSRALGKALLSSMAFHAFLLLVLAELQRIDEPGVPRWQENTGFTLVNLPSSRNGPKPASPGPALFKSIAPLPAPSSAGTEAERAPRPTSESNSSPGRPGSAGRENGARESYLSELRALIEQKKAYPPLARRLGESGVVSLEFSIRKDGSIADLRITKASPSPRLDEAALGLLSGIARHKPLPEEIGVDKLSVVLPIAYVLQ